MNCAAVLHALRDTGSARVTELVTATGLSRPTVTAAVSTLIDDGWVEEADSSDSSEASSPRMGRPARILRFRADARHVVGIDVGPHKIYCAVADLNGAIVAHVRRAVEPLSSPADLLEHVETTIGLAMAEASIPPSSLAAVGVGTPGIVDEQHESVVQVPSVPGWSSLELARLLRKNLGCPVQIENDVNLAVMAERWDGVGSDVDDLVLVQWGSRLGAAVLVQGNLHRGAHGAAGEIGFVDVEDEDPQGIRPDGQGPLEASIGTSWILRRARSLGDHHSPDAVAVLKAAAAGEEPALTVIDEACTHFARGFAPVLAALDPELVIIGGGITLAEGAIVEGIQRHLGARALVVPRLELSTLGDDAVALGAVRLALTEAEKRLLDAYASPGA
ncbi:ROK family transcriptional regulator [Actinobacteria bacterium YIM 96077]|uniref:ROK family transcriptional regulator n=2 Tax=Phytoactinopolyspora halophila TaxID=1981511 RepID=A0A329QAD3_9ACTN|nr:ROK family transcriptional regulator [Actinobacteria bacterium YIM 96077]RAW09283.1 ROK family transcriptional regulator [Phytoactinopolyspora halophila]